MTVLQCGTTSVISCSFPLMVKSFQTGSALEKEFTPRGANSFLEELTLSNKGVKNENDRVCFP